MRPSFHVFLFGRVGGSSLRYWRFWCLWASASKKGLTLSGGPERPPDPKAQPKIYPHACGGSPAHVRGQKNTKPLCKVSGPEGPHDSLPKLWFVKPFLDTSPQKLAYGPPKGSGAER